MKRLFLLLTTIVALSCSKETCTEYLIKNSSNLDLTLKFKRVDNLFNKNIQNKRTVNFGEISCGFEGITPITLELNDSIYI